MIDEALIDCEEDGFQLVLTGDFVDAFADYLAANPASRDSCTVRLRLSQDAALELAGSARSTIIPWSADHDEAQAAYRRRSSIRVSSGQSDDVGGPNQPTRFERGLSPVHTEEFAGVPGGIVEAADLSRKAARENA